MTEVLINGKWPLKVPDHKTNQEWWNVWEKERLQAMFETIKPGDTIFDIGAEEGDFTALFQQWAGKEGELVIVEPSVRMWPAIKAIWEANGLGAPYAAYQAFCGSYLRDGLIESSIKSFWPPCANGAISPEPGFYNMLERPDNAVLTIDRLVELHGLPDVVSIDVEGAEFEVMKGAVETMKAKKTVFFISVHSSFMEHDYGYAAEVFIGFMNQNGYVGSLLAIDHEHHFMFNPIK